MPKEPIIMRPKRGYFYQIDYSKKESKRRKMKKLTISDQRKAMKVQKSFQKSECGSDRSLIADVKERKLELASHFEAELKMVNLYRKSLEDENYISGHEELTVNYDFLIANINNNRDKLLEKLDIESYTHKEYLYLTNFYKSKIFEINTYILKLLDTKIDVTVGQNSEIITFMDSLKQKQMLMRNQKRLMAKIDKKEKNRKRRKRPIHRKQIRRIGSRVKTDIKSLITIKRRKNSKLQKPQNRKERISSFKSKNGSLTNLDPPRRSKRFITFTKKLDREDDQQTVYDESSSEDRLEKEDKSGSEAAIEKKSTMETMLPVKEKRNLVKNGSLPVLPNLSRSSYLTPIHSPREALLNSGFNRSSSKRGTGFKENFYIREKSIGKNGAKNVRKSKRTMSGLKIEIGKVVERQRQAEMNRGVRRDFEDSDEDDQYLLESERAKRKIQEYYQMMDRRKQK